jgi:hypothetical protein
MKNIIKFFIVGLTGMIGGILISNKINNKIKKDSICQTDIDLNYIKKAIESLEDLESIDNGTYKWKFV